MGVLIDTRSYGSTSELHKHDYHQIVLPRRGVLEIEVAGRGGLVDQRRGVFIPAGDRHDFRAAGENAFCVVDVPHGFFCAAPQCEPVLDRLQSSPFFDLGPLSFHLMNGASAIAGGAYADDLRATWTTLLLQDIAHRADLPPLRRPVVSRAIEFIRRNISETITVDDIAREAAVSQSVLYDMFKTETGVTPHAYLRDARLDYALELLAKSSLPISEIAVRSGYDGQSAFSRALKQKRGVTPAGWRRNAVSRRHIERGQVSHGHPSRGFADCGSAVGLGH